MKDDEHDDSQHDDTPHDADQDAVDPQDVDPQTADPDGVADDTDQAPVDEADPHAPVEDADPAPVEAADQHEAVTGHDADQHEAVTEHDAVAEHADHAPVEDTDQGDAVAEHEADRYAADQHDAVVDDAEPAPFAGADAAYDDEWPPNTSDDEWADQGPVDGPDGTYDDEWSEDTSEDTWSSPGPLAGAGRGALAAAALVGVVTTLVLVLIWSSLSGNGDDGGAATAGGDASPVGSVDAGRGTSESAGAVPTRLSRCISAHESLQEPLDAARPALDQWAVHVGAMNKLVVGEITLQQASAFWNRTRVGARRLMEAFNDAFETAKKRGVDCPSPGLLAPGARALPSCARAVEAEMRALRAAEVSLATWDEHIHHMDMLRLGDLTPEEATSMWLESWRRGVADLDAYEVAARGAAQQKDGCRTAG